MQVLVHGITYDHRYWNVRDPDGTNRYSWEAAAAAAGYATLAIDRLGSGSHPPSVQVDVNSNAAAVRAVVHALREGKIAAPGKAVPVRKVALVGHSYGSITSWFAASDNPEVDALLLTGATHNIIGSKDAVFCSLAAGDLGAPCDDEPALVENERPWLGPDVPSLTVHIVDGAGHALNAVRSSGETFGAAQSWLKRTLPAT